MSRAKRFNHDGEDIWFNKSAKATASQLELLADYESIELDDLLDEGLSQKQVVQRLYEHGTDIVPVQVVERRRKRQNQPIAACRICALDGLECEGGMTRHHFVPRWLMRELENYRNYSSRSMCTIPICVGRHRDLHLRDSEDKSIVRYLLDHERKFAQRMLDDLRDQHPKISDLIAAGDTHSYEYQLIRDWQQGNFLRHNRELAQALKMANSAT